MLSVAKLMLGSKAGGGGLEPPLPHVLPAGYTEVEYLGCNGGQYIETGLTVQNYVGYQLELKYRFTQNYIGENWCIGYWNTQPEWRIYLVGHYFENLRCGVGPDNSTHHCTMPFDTNWHVAELKLDGAYLDGVKGAEADLYKMPQPTTTSIWLGKSSHADAGLPRQIGFCRMWTVEGRLARDFVPVRASGGSGWYDLKTGAFFHNAGSGSFDPGPDVA